MEHQEVSLPWTDTLLPWALENDPETARIIQAVQAKAAKWQPPDCAAQAAQCTCENCGLPSWAVSGPGMSISIEDRPENRFQRTRRRTVWCHSEECAVQCLAISKYGRASHKWPITLAEFRATQSQPAAVRSSSTRPYLIRQVRRSLSPQCGQGSEAIN